jgi:transcriptional regulator with XRE-family HTH domain
MTKKTLGQVIKKGRAELRITQRQLADQVGVKPSHIAYIEGGQRRPSIALLKRIAEVLGLNSRELLFLAHPEARFLVGERAPAPRTGKNSWLEFERSSSLLRRHQVTRAELKVLKQISLLEEITHPEHFVFILNSIRQAAVPED